MRNIYKIISLILLLNLVGCYGKVEPSRMYVISALGVERENSEYNLTAQIFNPATLKTGENIYLIVSSKGETLMDAVNNLYEVVPGKIILAYLNLLIIDEKLAQQGFKPVLDYIGRENDIKSLVNIIITKDITPYELLNAGDIMGRSPSFIMSSVVNINYKYRGTTKFINDAIAIQQLLTPGVEPIMPVATIEQIPSSNPEQPSKNIIIIDTIGVFKEDKLIGYLDDSDVITYNMIMDNFSNGTLSFKCSGDNNSDNSYNSTIEFLKFKAKRNVDYKNGRVIVDLNVTGQFKLGESECDINIRDDKTLASLEKLVGEQIKENIMCTIKNIQKNYKADIFGFGTEIYRDDYNSWKEIKETWDYYFSNAKINVKTNFVIINVGQNNGTIIEEVGDKK